MKKTVTTIFIAATALTLAACGGSKTTTENTVVTNEVVLDEGSTDNLTAVDALNDSAVALDNAAAATENAANAVENGAVNAN
ncbi:MAG: circumsporozoite protein [Pseudomonadota bacterium]